jgi:CubicO group peptidase (beta-lactamase class C family)
LGKEKNAVNAQASRRTATHGYARKGFQAVREAFVENFERRNDLGAACCIYYRGEKVVDLWGGVRSKISGEPWEEDTMVVVFSATKGLAAMTLALAHSRGRLDYDERICTYWPEFAQAGKEKTTVRQLLAHQAGLFAFDAPVDKGAIADLDRLAAIMAAQKPAWEPGMRQAYHAISLGFYEGELLRRIDPQHRSLGQFFQDEIAAPLGLECYIRLPTTIPNARLAQLDATNPLQSILALPFPLMLDCLNRRSIFYRSMIANPGTLVALDDEHIYARNFEAPSGGGVGTARAIAHAYSAFASSGGELGLRSATLAELMAPAVPARCGFYDECVRGEAAYSLGFMKPNGGWPFGPPSAFGAPGSGGSFAFADPQAGLAYAYVTNRTRVKLTADPRDQALRAAMAASVAVLST